MVMDLLIAAATCILGQLSVHWARALNGYHVEDSDGRHAASLESEEEKMSWNWAKLMVENKKQDFPIVKLLD